MPTRRNFLEKWTQFAAGALAAGSVTASTSEAQAQEPQEPKKKLHIMMRSSWGTDEPTRASFVFGHGLALADAGHEVQISHPRRYVPDAQGDGGCGETHRMAAPERDHGEGGGQTHTDICLRSLLPDPWGHGGGLEQLERAMGNGSDLRFAGGMGRPRHQ